MQYVTFRGLSQKSSVLGFGCVKLTAQKSRADALRTLDIALEHGITHFDTARLYGMGQCEGIVGEFLKGKRDKVTVTTKFGLRPPVVLGGNRKLISFAKQAVRKIPFLEKYLKRRIGGTMPAGIYTPEEVHASLDISLRELATDYVDILLMHEALPTDATPEVLAALDDEVKKGRIRAYGFGSIMPKLGYDAALLPAGCTVLQFDSSATDRHLARMQNKAGRDIIAFGVLSPLRAMMGFVQSNPDQVRGLSDQAAGLDLSNRDVLGGLLIDDAVRQNPSGITLVATVTPARIAANSRAAAGDAYTDAQREAFNKLIEQVAVPPVATTH